MDSVCHDRGRGGFGPDYPSRQERNGFHGAWEVGFFGISGSDWRFLRRLEIYDATRHSPEEIAAAEISVHEAIPEKMGRRGRETCHCEKRLISPAEQCRLVLHG